MTVILATLRVTPPLLGGNPLFTSPDHRGTLRQKVQKKFLLARILHSISDKISYKMPHIIHRNLARLIPPESGYRSERV